jgi:hypothetical protein
MGWKISLLLLLPPLTLPLIGYDILNYFFFLYLSVGSLGACAVCCHAISCSTAPHFFSTVKLDRLKILFFAPFSKLVSFTESC